MLNRERQTNSENLRDIENEITEGLALLGRWSHLYEKLHPEGRTEWKAIVAKAQGSSERHLVRDRLDRFIQSTLRPMVERID